MVKDALFRQAEQVYEWMLERADSDGLFTGQTTLAIKELRIANSKYSAVFKLLRDLNCVVQIKRGGGKDGQSEWQLYGAPDLEKYWATKDNPENAEVSRLRMVENLLREQQQKIEKLEKNFVEMYKFVKVIYDTQQKKAGGGE